VTRKGKGSKTTAGASQEAQGEAQSTADEPEGLTQEEVAKRVGCGQSTVWRAIARGDIAPIANGRLPESAVDTMRELRAKDAAQDAVTGDLERRLLAAQAGEREAKQKLRELELQRESGRFVELALVQKDAEDARERILSVLRAIPQRTAMAVDGALAAPADRRAAVLEKIIADEVERAIAELAESKFGGAKQ